jgi:glutaredoxin
LSPACADAFKFKIKSAYDWGEARLEAIEQLTGTRELPVVYVNGTYIGGAESKSPLPKFHLFSWPRRVC